MNLRENINKIHFNLNNQFDDVKIEEKSNIELGSCVEMTINESEKQVRLVVTKKSLENYRFDWKYLSNPLNESSTQVERTSNVDDFTADIKDIFDRNRFDSDYIKVLEGHVFSKEYFIGKKITNIIEDRDITIETGKTSFGIGCMGGNTTLLDGDEMIGEIISDIIIDEYLITITSESGKKVYIEDDTGGEGLEIYKIN